MPSTTLVNRIDRSTFELVVIDSRACTDAASEEAGSARQPGHAVRDVDWREFARICSTECLCDREKYWMGDLFSENKSEAAG